MQLNVENLKESVTKLFPKGTITIMGTQVKCHVSSLLNKDFDKLAKLRGKGNDVTAKRSGTGITIIVSPVNNAG